MASDAAVFACLREEAKALEDSELLGPAIRKHILGAKSLQDAIAAVIASRMATTQFLEEEALRKVCAEALKGDARPTRDLLAILERDPAAISTLQVITCLKGYHAVQAHRVAAALWKTGNFEKKHVALAIQNRVSELFAVDVHPGATIGGGILMDRATGVVIGETAVIGEDCTILHGVTLGGTGKERGDRHPKIGDRVTLGAGATVLGNIKVGDGATVGSQAVVTKDIPPGMTVVGLNKLLDPKQSRQKTLEGRNDTWQYETEFEGYEYFGAVTRVG